MRLPARKTIIGLLCTFLALLLLPLTANASPIDPPEDPHPIDLYVLNDGTWEKTVGTYTPNNFWVTSKPLENVKADIEHPTKDGEEPVLYYVLAKDPESAGYGTTYWNPDMINTGLSHIDSGNVVPMSGESDLYLVPIWVSDGTVAGSDASMTVHLVDTARSSSMSKHAFRDPEHEMEQQNKTVACAKNVVELPDGDSVEFHDVSFDIPVLTECQETSVSLQYPTEGRSDVFLSETKSTHVSIYNVPATMEVRADIDTGFQLAAMNDDGSYDYYYVASDSVKIYSEKLPAGQQLGGDIAVYEVTISLPNAKEVYGYADDLFQRRGDDGDFGAFSWDISQTIPAGTTPDDCKWIVATNNGNGTFTIKTGHYNFGNIDGFGTPDGATHATPEGYAAIVCNHYVSTLRAWNSSVIRIVEKASTEPGTTPDEKPDTDQTAKTITMYRLYNQYTGEHLYTASASERDSLKSIGWTYEGVGWVAPATGDPVYRLFNPYSDDHHYTMKADERDALKRLGWRDEGVGWYSGGDVPVLRQFNPYAVTATHNYTVSREENDALVKIGWRAEGAGWYAVSAK
ncbi:hypothetical protein [Thermophilibacter provencensis]|uniref:DUF5648 domain-containing protein n=1 Tax=Thermophilibacter provencensis TaxID=1852386 RepID=A0ABT7V3D4_9ACTN|nr:hypothetical protein [Thermophilibacter provencensis]MDM8271099.1 hypothetical protein [Thermophilibacter provencensis]